jgi:hypothetical protein
MMPFYEVGLWDVERGCEVDWPGYARASASDFQDRKHEFAPAIAGLLVAVAVLCNGRVIAMDPGKSVSTSDGLRIVACCSPGIMDL